MEVNLFMVCVSSLAAVFGVLAMLAVAMRLIMIAFPAKVKIVSGTAGEGGDAAIYAAISAMYSKNFPGTRVTRIEEEKKK
jgi:hypothetical protein